MVAFERLEKISRYEASSHRPGFGEARLRSQTYSLMKKQVCERWRTRAIHMTVPVPDEAVHRLAVDDRPLALARLGELLVLLLDEGVHEVERWPELDWYVLARQLWQLYPSVVPAQVPHNATILAVAWRCGQPP